MIVRFVLRRSLVLRAFGFEKLRLAQIASDTRRSFMADARDPGIRQPEF
jgi:hypothetical protein